jgi:hypothetical protein
MKRLINNNLSKLSVVLIVLWFGGQIFMSLFVPFSSFGSKGMYLDIAKYDWIFLDAEPFGYFNYYLINFKLISLKMFTLSVLMLSLAYIFNNTD